MTLKEITMEMGKLRHLISNLRRHYNLSGEDILACYDTAVWALFGSSNDLQNAHDLRYATVSVSPAQFKRLKEQLDESYQCKHPGSNVPCLKFFDDRLYVRSEHRIKDEDVIWSKRTGCYTPVARKLWNQLEAIVMSKSSTRKQLGHANTVLIHLKRRPEMKVTG